MRKRVGITHDPEERRGYWENEHPIQNWKIVKENLTYEEAQKLENHYIIEKGYEGSQEAKRNMVKYILSILLSFNNRMV